MQSLELVRLRSGRGFHWIRFLRRLFDGEPLSFVAFCAFNLVTSKVSEVSVAAGAACDPFRYLSTAVLLQWGWLRAGYLSE